ncbi:thiamine pyrophosphate-binding protein [Streptomyces sp. URMC 126]|uniref:thiamine pyrophosphate-binding protein n=1 Tax=Streptomyces sp. URMC 126 TaxID=3423401 RepID=UPI003F1E4518
MTAITGKKNTDAPPPRGVSPSPADADAATAADRIVDFLVRSGVTTFFGVPGGPALPVVDAVLRHAGARLIESRHETTAVFSAMGFRSTTGRVPCVLFAAGPGATNAVTGVAAAHRENVPLVLVCGDAGRGTPGEVSRDTVGDGPDAGRLYGTLTRARVRLTHPACAVACAAEVHEAATGPGAPGPALLVVPADVAGAAAPATAVHRGRPAAPPPDRGLLDAAAATAEALAAAGRPLVVVGAGAAPGARLVRQLVETLDVPFATTPRAKGVIDELHPLSLRGCGTAGSRWARRYVSEGVDVALVLGTDLDDRSAGPTPLVAPGGKLIHVDADPRVLSRSARATTAVVADAGLFSGHVCETALRLGLRHRGAHDVRRQAVRDSPFDVPGHATDCTYPVAPHRVLRDLQDAVGPRARFVTDVGEHMLFALHYLTARDPQAFGVHSGPGSVGSGIGSAIGRALGDPSRPVVCVCGDDGMRMCGSEILVAVRHRLPVLFAVFNDARRDTVHHDCRERFGRAVPWSAPPVNFVAWAQAHGVPGRRINRAGEITPQLVQQLMKRPGPAVLDIRHNPGVRVRGAGRAEAPRP